MISKRDLAEQRDGLKRDVLAIAKQALCVMIFDMDYIDYNPHNGWAPIRHQMLWAWACEALGEDEAEKHIDRLREYARKHPDEMNATHAWRTTDGQLPA